MGNFDADVSYSPLETLLSEIISSDTLGVDRMDYLLRDSHHIGVAYGNFDHHRLIDTMRLLPIDQASRQPTLGITDGGIHTAEALLLARYSMFMQVYYHRTRVAYDCLAEEFLRAWLPGGKISTSIDEFQRMTDNTVIAAITESANDLNSPCNDAAKRILGRGHFRLLYRETAADWQNLDHRYQRDPARSIFEEISSRSGAENFRHVAKTQNQPDFHFPVLDSDLSVVSSKSISESLNQIPVARFGFVLVVPELAESARKWLDKEKARILSQTE